MTWRLQRAGNLACQAGQHGASRQSIKYSIQHSQFMDLIPQKKTPSKITKRNLPLAPPHLFGAVWVYQNWSLKKKKGTLSMESRVWRQSCSGIILVRGLIDFHPRPPSLSQAEESGLIESESSKVQSDLFYPMLWYGTHSSPDFE